MNERMARVIQMHKSLAVVLPKDWTRYHRLGPGDRLKVVYNGVVRISVPSSEEVLE